MSRRRQARDIIAQLEDQRTRLDGVRERARRQGGPEGERLEAQVAVRLRESSSGSGPAGLRVAGKRARGGEDGPSRGSITRSH